MLFASRRILLSLSSGISVPVLLPQQLCLSEVCYNFSRATLRFVACCFHVGICSKGPTEEQNAQQQCKADADLKALIRSFTSSIKLCAENKDLYRGSALHADISSLGLLNKTNHLENTLISMYAKCGALAQAKAMVCSRSDCDVVAWNALIAGYIQHQKGEDALICFERMQNKGCLPNTVTYACILKACTMITKGQEIGREIHEKVGSMGLLQNDVVLGNSIINMYVKCGALRKAEETFCKLPIRNVITWSTLIMGYAQQEDGMKALQCFESMRREGLSPNAITYASVLKACGITQDFRRGKEIHGEIANQGLLDMDIVLGNAVLDMYVKCGALTHARQALETMPLRDVISWSAMIVGHVQHEQGEEALDCFQEMQRERIPPNGITYVGILKACGITQEVDIGEQIHHEIHRQGLLTGDVILGTALIDMYSKCGLLSKAKRIFDGLTVHDATAWNALIAGYAQHGLEVEVFNCVEGMLMEGLVLDIVCWNALLGAYAQQGLAEEAELCFHEMQVEGISPDSVTFVNVLNLCSHAGLVDEGQICFSSMIKEYGVFPNKQHQTCLVDLFGRARHFDKALRVIEMMPFLDYSPVWSAFLSAGRDYVNVDLCRSAFEQAVQLGGTNAGLYVLMSNAYATNHHGNRGTCYCVFMNG